MQNRKKIIIFDLDGTLYELRGGSYKKSLLQQSVLRNAQKYIAAELCKTQSEARHILQGIQRRYGEQISIGLEKEFGIDRHNYFSTVWDISAHGIVKKTQGLRKTLLALRKKYKLVLVSDAPGVWINNVLKELELQDIFRGSIFSGEGNRRKEFGNAFSSVIRILKVNPSDCIVVGDQENSDIIPAKSLGMRTIFVHRTKRSSLAGVCIKSILDLPTGLEKISEANNKKHKT